MTPREADSGIAFVTDSDGTVLRLIRDGLGFPSPLRPGVTFVSLIAPSSAAKAGHFLASLKERGAAFGCELTTSAAMRSLSMHFTGAAQEGALLIIAARRGEALTRGSEELSSIDNEQANSLPAALDERSVQQGGTTAGSRHLFEDLSRVNNELATLQREMVRKNAELERLTEQKNRILGMAAHDLRSPLGVILSYSEFLEVEAADVLDAEQREFVAVIKETSQFLLLMVTDILDVTAIESGQLRLDRKPTDLTHLVRRNVKLNQALASPKDIAVVMAEPAALSLLPLDAGKIEQVLNNLVGNAVKFSHRGGRVEVRLSEADRFVTVAVQDQGQGIPASDFSKLFKPFGRASVLSTAGEPSTGLGLAIVRNIVEGHGGRIWLESEVGKGSTFYFTLPTAQGV